MKVKDRQNYKPGPKDECGSPPYAVTPLVKQIESYRRLMGISKKEFVIWEPATGMGDIKHSGLVQGFTQLGYTVVGTPRYDFCSVTEDAVRAMIGFQGIKMIATNPPFSVKLKRCFVNKCEQIFGTFSIPYALLMNTTSLTEKINGQTMIGCSLHIPLGRICYSMPNQGWGTEEKPTKATFSTNWFVKGLVENRSIFYDTFDVSNHFDALRRFNEMSARIREANGNKKKSGL